MNARYLQIVDLSDAELDAAYDNAVADYALAVKYDHNAHLLPAITQRLNACRAEYAQRDRTPPHTFAAPAPAPRKG